MSDEVVRHAAFAYLERLTGGDPERLVTWAALTLGLVVNGQPVGLIGASGIWKPAVCELPISVTTAPPKAGRAAPYDDHMTADGYLRYAYRGTDPQHPHNVGMRRLMAEHVPLIYLHGVTKGEYLAQWPVYIVEDHPEALYVTVDLDNRVAAMPAGLGLAAEPSQGYAARMVLTRLHQRAFRERVLRAYQQACAMCRLKHVALLDAAHILGDTDPRSTPSTSNGIALCKIHHAAFDQHILGVRPDLVVEVRADILAEVDGPMLRYGLQAMDGQALNVPTTQTDRPDEALIEERYAVFRTASA